MSKAVNLQLLLREPRITCSFTSLRLLLLQRSVKVCKAAATLFCLSHRGQKIISFRFILYKTSLFLKIWGRSTEYLLNMRTQIVSHFRFLWKEMSWYAAVIPMKAQSRGAWQLCVYVGGLLQLCTAASSIKTLDINWWETLV